MVLTNIGAKNKISNSLESGGVYMQIGTMDGRHDDFFNMIVEEKNPDKIILVEPNPSLIPVIAENYKHLKNVFIENVAVSDKKEIITLSRPSSKFGFDDGHFSMCRDDWDNIIYDDKDMCYIEAQGVTFGSILKKHNLTHLDYLQIDTEGFDTEIIKTIDFDTVAISVLSYEIWEHNKKGMSEVDTLLKSKNYTLFEINTDIVGVKNYEIN